MNVVLGIIATINISTILEVDKIAKPLREFLGIKHFNGYPSEPTELEGIKGFFGNLLYCYKCITVWVGLLLATVWFINESVYKFIITAFSFSWLAWFLNQISSWLLQKTH